MIFDSRFLFLCDYRNIISVKFVVLYVFVNTQTASPVSGATHEPNVSAKSTIILWGF